MRIRRPTFQHIIIEAIDDSGNLNSIAWLNTKARLLIKKLSIQVEQYASHQFSPQGVTLVFILSSSHLVIHTWPEKNYLHFDLLNCSLPRKLESVKIVVSKIFECKEVYITEIHY